MRQLIRPFRLMMLELSAMGRFWFLLGFCVLIAAALMSFDFGYQVSLKHALFLGLLTVVTAFGPDACSRAWTQGRKVLAFGIMIALTPFIAIEFYSHAGYTAGLRGTNVTTAHVQQAAYDMAQADAQDNKANLEMWRGHLAQLEKEAPWAATVTAQALRIKLETANKAIELETKRGGCGPICERKMRERDEVAKQLGQVEQMTNYRQMIEATQRILDKKRTTAVAATYTPSAVQHQNEFLAATSALITTGSVDASPTLRAAVDQSVSLAMAFAGTALPGFAFFMAGLYRVREIEEELPPVDLHTSTQAPKRALPKVVAQAAPPEAPSSMAREAEALNINLPVNITHTAHVEGEAQPMAHARKIGLVRDTAFARRVEQITRHYR